MNEKYQKILDMVKEEIGLVKSNLSDKLYFYDSLNTGVLRLLNAPSKHIRTLVSFLYLKACGQNIDENQILYQTAIEFVHNASLIHDDVIDESFVRRNVETLNAEFDNKLAVITGDYLLSVALDKVLKIGNLELIQMFSDTLKVMSEGEITQQFNKFKIPTIEEYIKKSEQKTAKLFETALCGSLLIAKSDFDGLQFAKNFGIAFQIRDDLINFKTTNSDIAEGIYTAPVIFAGTTDVDDCAIEKTKTLLNNYINNAESNLYNLEQNDYKQALLELLELLKYE